MTVKILWLFALIARSCDRSLSALRSHFSSSLSGGQTGLPGKLHFGTPLLNLILGVVIFLGGVPPVSGQTEASTNDFVCAEPVPQTAFDAKLRAVEQKYQQINSLQGTFTQHSHFIGLDKNETSKGQVFFQKPGKMHWIYNTPEEQRFIADGETVWFFQPNLNQVTLDSFKESFTTDLPVTFLLGLGRISNSFRAAKVCTNAERTVLELKPTAPDSSLQQFTLVVRSDDFTPVGARVLDLVGNETEILLGSLQVNTPIAADQFTFKVPKGVDIIDQRQNKSGARSVTEKNLLEMTEGDRP